MPPENSRLSKELSDTNNQPRVKNPWIQLTYNNIRLNHFRIWNMLKKKAAT